MRNPNLKLIIEITSSTENLVRFTLCKGAKLNASIISPKRLIEMHNGIFEPPDLEETVQSQVLKSVMGECTHDINGKCTLKEAVELIRALNHKQEVELVF
jgi:hypothetical protein